MEDRDVTKLKIGKNTIGILGLKKVMEDISKDYADKPDELVSKELLSRVSRKNYIPGQAREDYGRALLREFKKFLGQANEESNPSGELEIRVLGQGCSQCDRLEMEIISVLTELGIVADFEHVRDLKEIGRYGVMGMPALLINGKVKCVGRVPPRGRIMEWIAEAHR